MRFLDSIVIMAPAFFLHAVTATPLTTSKECVPNPKIISSLTDSFTLAIVAEDRDGRNNLKNSNPVILSTVGLFSGVEASRPAVDTANLSKSNPVGFLLKKGKLIFEGGSEAALLGPRAKPNVRGLRQFLFDPKPDPSFVPLEPINFTATGACDSLGRSYLRLGTEDGSNNFAILPAQQNGIQLFIKGLDWNQYYNATNEPVITVALSSPPGSK